MGAKAERTREALADVALRLFRERGYEATTMRLVAQEAGVSVGNAYHHFEGKDAFVQELYRRIQIDHRARAVPALRVGAPLAENLRSTWHAGLDVMGPYHSFGATLLHVALMPTSAASPFSTASTEPREAAIEVVRATLDASRGTPPDAFGDRLPHLLWLAWMGVTLQWVTDTSPDQRRTRDLVDGAAPLLARAIRLTRLPGGRGLARDVVALVDRLWPGHATAPSPEQVRGRS